MSIKTKAAGVICLGGALLLMQTSASALTLNFDFSYDSNNFFSDPARKNVLLSAGSYFESILNDNLTAIQSGGINHFNATFSHPGTGAQTTINDFSVAADTLTIFAGGRMLSGSTLGQGGPGGYSASGTFAFLDNAKKRGQAGETQGPTATDFAPWGGSITFDTDSTWYFDTDPSTTEAFSGNDFYSVALHELGHLLGLGIADSWYANISSVGNVFTGTASVASYGSPVPLTSTGSHWANGTTSLVGGVSQEAAMDPSITTGTRKVFTDLDNAALADIGWQVSAVPVPPAIWLFGSGVLTLFGLRRRAA